MTRGPAHKKILPILLIVAAGILAYWNSFEGVFVYDDIHSIRDNPHIRRLWPLSEAMSIPLWSSGTTVDGRPLLSLTFALNRHFLGADPRGYHLVNIIIHILAGLLLFGVVRRTLFLPRFRDRFDACGTWVALAVALIWVVHPLNTEAVMYIVQRAESLMGLLFLLTLYSAIRAFTGSEALKVEGSRFKVGDQMGGEVRGKEPVVSGQWEEGSREQGTGNQERRTKNAAARWRIAAVAACAIGMAVKQTMFSAPLMVLLYDGMFVSNSIRAALVKRKWFYGALFATWLIVFGIIGLTWQEATADFVRVNPLNYLLTQPLVLLYYLRLALWPSPLVLDYGWALEEQWPRIVFPGLAILGMLAIMFQGIRHRRWYGFVLAWFFFILAPTSSIAPTRQPLFEHRMYLSLAAVVMVIVLGAEWIITKAVGSRGRRAAVGSGLTVAALLVLGYLTHARNSDYHTEIGMWRDSLAHRSSGQSAHLNLGCCLLDQGKYAEAVSHFHMALKIESDYDYPEAHSNLGSALFGQRRYAEAIWHYQRALQLLPGSAVLNYNAGVALEAAGRLKEALECYRTAVRIQPDFANGHLNLGNVLMALNRPAEAIQIYCRAVELEPDDADIHNNLGVAYRQCGRLAEATAQFQQALRLKPDHAMARKNLREMSAMTAGDR